MKDIIDKDKLRKIYLAKRKRIKKKKFKECTLNLRLFEFLKKKKKKSIAGYFSFRGELDITPSINYLKTFQFKISLPFIDKINKPLLFKEWAKNVPLETGRYNIKVPKTNIFSDPEIIIVPLLAFNNKKFRLGYGGGFYDRTIQERKHKIFSIGIGFDEQEAELLPTDIHDQSLDMVLTPSRLII